MGKMCKTLFGLLEVVKNHKKSFKGLYISVLNLLKNSAEVKSPRKGGRIAGS